MGMRDFDFFPGTWRVAHRRLKKRLDGCSEWDAFGGTCTTQLTLGGQGNMDDNVIDAPSGSYRAVTIRAFDPASETWAIWWLDARYPQGPLEPAMKGRFENGIGLFYADDMLDGRPITVRFIWSNITATTARWEQAFSADGRETWETNWTMDFTRIA